MNIAALPPLLTQNDPEPIELVNADSDAPVLLLCEHAGLAIPEALGDLGVSAEARASHRGWDIGAATVARHLADHLGAPLILQRYSRLVIDANRPPGGVESMPETVDGVAIPANKGLSAGEKEARIAAIFRPMDRAIGYAFEAAERRAAFSIHSYTPRLGGVDRPWHAGFLTRRSIPTAERLMASVARAAPEWLLAVNEPYRIDDETDWFIPVHAEARGLPHCLIEIRNDLIDAPAGAAQWACLLAEAISDVMRTPS